VASPPALIGWIIGFDDSAEIVAPAALRQRFVDHLASA
jgi:hypothetical protein